MADRQLSMFDGLEYVDDAERPAGEKSCRLCAFVYPETAQNGSWISGRAAARILF